MSVKPVTAVVHRRVRAAALACGALTLLAVAPADAAPAWLAPVGLSEEGESASEPRVAFDTGGDAVAVWSRDTGAYNPVQATFRPAGGTWQPPVNVSMYGQSDHGASEPRAAFDPRGDALAIWDAYNGSTFNVQAAFRPAGGAWQLPVNLSSQEIPGADDPQVAFDAQGDAIALWHRGSAINAVMQAAFRPAGGSWQTAVNVSEAGAGAYDPQIAFDRQGDAIAVWERYDGSNYIVQAALRSADGSWQPPVNVSEAGETAERPQVAFDGQGDAVAVWERWTNGLFSTRVVQAGFMPTGGTWQTPVNLSEEGDEPSETATEPQVALDALGDAVAVWSRGNAAQAAFMPAGGIWQTAVNVSEVDGTVGETATEPQVALDALGDAVAVWRWQKSHSEAGGITQAAFMPAGGAWKTPVSLSEEGHDAYGPQVAFDGQGDAVAAWSSEDGAHETIVEAAGYAAAGPQLNGLSIPTTGAVGQSLTFSASPLDIWSALRETIWSFGDGASASGMSATHTYASAGSYEVALRSTDIFGNSTSASGTIKIAREPPIATSPQSAPTSAPPTITAASQSARTWRESGKAPLGTTFSLSLNEQAVVRLSFVQRLPGRTVGHKCVTKTSKDAKRAVCRRTVLAGIVSFAGHRGQNKVAFRGRISRSSTLKPGRYKLIASAANSSGTSLPKSLYFTIAN